MEKTQVIETIPVVEDCTVVQGRFAAHQARWNVIRQYPMPFGTEYLRYKHGWGEKFSLGALREYKRFAFLAMSGDAEITPSIAVDEVWHLHILHTRAYDQFAEATGYFLHHNPGLPTQQVQWDTQYDLTFERYQEAFGVEAPVQLWPRREINTPSIAAVLSSYRAVQSGMQ